MTEDASGRDAPRIPRPHVIVYTDGACKGNPGPGGWGALLRSGANEKELFGGERQTTNNRMELTAVIEALASLKRTCDVTLHTDSEYVRKGITEWIHAWKQRGWKTAEGACRRSRQRASRRAGQPRVRAGALRRRARRLAASVAAPCAQAVHLRDSTPDVVHLDAAPALNRR